MKQPEVRANVNVKFSIPEKNHLKVLAAIIEILHKAKTRDFEFIRLDSSRLDGYLSYDADKQPEINPKYMAAVRMKSGNKTNYKVEYPI